MEAGISSSLRHLCAATLPGRVDYLRYDRKGKGLWNLVFVAGLVIGGLLAGTWTCTWTYGRLRERLPH